MFYINNRCTDVYFNLAAEEYLLKQKEGNFFMLWQAESSVIIGKHQSVQAEVDLDFAQRQGIHVARRFSGGGAVYHDKGNVNLTFIETINGQPYFEYYLQQTIDFLDSVGITAYADKRLGIYVDKRKISGSAQCIHKNKIMYHCTLLFSTDLVSLDASLKGKYEREDCVPGSPSVRAVPSVRSEVTNISSHLQIPIDIKRFMHFLFQYFLDSNDNNRIYRFTDEDVAIIERLKREKYANDEWTFNKSALKSC